MCNLYRLHKSADEIHRIFAEIGQPLLFPEGVPNIASVDHRITDPGPIVRVGKAGPELVVRRWSWPLPNGKPLYNFKSEGRTFDRNRCLAIADGFYEFTTPTDPKQKRKDRWLFMPSAGGLLGIASIWREHPDVGEAYTLLTAEPGADVAPLHHRQIVLLDPSQWGDWLANDRPARDFLKPSPPGFLKVEAAPTI